MRAAADALAVRAWRVVVHSQVDARRRDSPLEVVLRQPEREREGFGQPLGERAQRVEVAVQDHLHIRHRLSWPTVGRVEGRAALAAERQATGLQASIEALLEIAFLALVLAVLVEVLSTDTKIAAEATIHVRHLT